MKHQNKIIDYMNENLRGYSFGQLRHAALSRLSYPGADPSAEDCPEIRMPEDVALYLVNNVLHNLPHNDRLKAKGDAAEGEKKDLIDKHYRMIVDGAEDDIRDLRKQGYAEADVRKLAEQYAEEEMGREADRSGAYSDLDSAIAFASDLYGYFRLSIFERLSFFERYRALEFGESASGAENADRRLVCLHIMSLVARRVASQDDVLCNIIGVLLYEERVLHIAGGMVGGEVQLGEHVCIVIDFRSVGKCKSHV